MLLVADQVLCSSMLFTVLAISITVLESVKQNTSGAATEMIIFLFSTC